MKNRNLSILFALFAVCALSITLILGELTVRLVSSKKHIYNIEMVKYASKLKMRDPEGLVSHLHKPNSSANLMGVDIQLNSLGHRSRELNPEKSPNEKRIYLLGASGTLGWGVPQEETYAFLIEKELNSSGSQYHYEVVNAGIGNYGTKEQYLLLKKQLSQVKPDYLLLTYYISDVIPREVGNDNPIYHYSYLAAYLANAANVVSYALSGKSSLSEYYSQFYDSKNPHWIQAKENLNDIKKLCEENGISFSIVMFPDIHNLTQGTPLKSIYEKIESDLKGMDIKTLNTFPSLQAEFAGRESEIWIQANDPHPNAKGHKVIAEQLLKFLKDERIIVP
jgi:lysophospholipase L1-like esterase